MQCIPISQSVYCPCIICFDKFFVSGLPYIGQSWQTIKITIFFIHLGATLKCNYHLKSSYPSGRKKPMFDITQNDNSIHKMPFVAHSIICNLFIRKYFNCPIPLFKNAYSCFYFCFSFPFPPFQNFRGINKKFVLQQSNLSRIATYWSENAS